MAAWLPTNDETLHITEKDPGANNDGATSNNRTENQ
jgi:hypothetical protein